MLTKKMVPCATCNRPKIANLSPSCRICYRLGLPKAREEAQPKLTVDRMDPLQRETYGAIMNGRRDEASDLDARRMVEIATERNRKAILTWLLRAAFPTVAWLPEIDPRNYLVEELDWHTAPLVLESRGRSSLAVAMAAVWG